MKKAFQKRVILGLAGIIGTVLVAALVLILGDSQLNKLVISLFMGIALGAFLGFLEYIFAGLPGFIAGFVQGTIVVALAAGSRLLPDWLFGLLMLVVVGAFVCLPIIKQYKKDQLKNGDGDTNPKLEEEIRQEEVEEQEEQAEEDEFNRLVGLGENSLILLTKMSGFFQMIKGNGRFYLVHAGGEVSGLDGELIKTDFSDESAYLTGKKDYTIEYSAITEIQYNNRRSVGTQLLNSGNVILKTADKRYAFTVINSVSPDRMAAFFEGLPYQATVKTKPTVPVRILNDEEKMILPGLKKVSMALMIVSILCGVALLFLPIDYTQYCILSGLSILIPVITLGLYIKFQNLLSLDDKTNGDDKEKSFFKKTSVQIITPLFVPSGVLLLRTVLDFTVTDYNALVIWAVALFVVLSALFFGLTQEYRRSKGIIAFALFIFLMYAPAVVVQVNCLYDFTEPYVYETSLVDKHISTGSRSPDQYIYTVQTEEGKSMDVSVTEEFYKTRETGDMVLVLDYPGLLGIDYVFIDESESH